VHRRTAPCRAGRAGNLRTPRGTWHGNSQRGSDLTESA